MLLRGSRKVDVGGSDDPGGRKQSVREDEWSFEGDKPSSRRTSEALQVRQCRPGGPVVFPEKVELCRLGLPRRLPREIK